MTNGSQDPPDHTSQNLPEMLKNIPLKWPGQPHLLPVLASSRRRSARHPDRLRSRDASEGRIMTSTALESRLATLKRELRKMSSEQQMTSEKCYTDRRRGNLDRHRLRYEIELLERIKLEYEEDAT